MSIVEALNGGKALQHFKLAGLPPDFYYIPNFITAEEEASILNKIPTNRWTTLSHRRLQAHPSTLLKGHTLLASPLPDWLVRPIIPRFDELDIFSETPHKAPNHVLVNEYKRGEGIMPHEDGEVYAGVVATVSLGSSLCLKITEKATISEDTEESNDLFSNQITLPTRILQEPRSLLITNGVAYRDLLHGIEEADVDEGLCEETVANWNLLGDRERVVEDEGKNERGTRVSLTYRDVLKVSKAAGKVFGVGRR